MAAGRRRTGSRVADDDIGKDFQRLACLAPVGCLRRGYSSPQCTASASRARDSSARRSPPDDDSLRTTANKRFSVVADVGYALLYRRRQMSRRRQVTAANSFLLLLRAAAGEDRRRCFGWDGRATGGRFLRIFARRAAAAVVRARRDAAGIAGFTSAELVDFSFRGERLRRYFCILRCHYAIRAEDASCPMPLA